MMKGIGKTVMKKITLKKINSFIALIAISLSTIGFNAYADNLNSQKVIGTVLSNIPYIQVEIKNNEIENSDVSAKIGSSDLSLYSLNSISEQKMLTYIFIDNSSSMTQDNICPDGSFEELKSGLKEFVEKNTNDNNNFAVYSIGEGTPKKLGLATNSQSAETVGNEISELSGNEDATNLNETLSDMFTIASQSEDEYQIKKFLLITDSSADYSNGIDVSEINEEYQYNKIPLYTICNTTSENSESFKQLRTVSRNSGGEGKVYNYTENKDSLSIIDSVYKEMTYGKIATFITTVPADSNTRELILNVKGTSYSETVKLDKAANIDAPVNASVQVNDNYNAFIISFSQNGFTGNLPVNDNALNNSSFVITKGSSSKSMPVQKVNRNEDGSFTVTVKDDIYSGKYNFSFPSITDLSSNENPVLDLTDVEIEAKNPFWKLFPYLVAVVAVAIVALVFYLILLNLKKKKNVKTIKELFETQVNETVEEKHYIQNIVNQGKEIRLFCQTANFPQKRITLKVTSSIIVGRSNVCDVFIEDSKMSRQHFAVEYTDGVFMISDLESVNGTFVNGVKVLGRQRLNSGDLIIAGLTKIRIEF